MLIKGRRKVLIYYDIRNNIGQHDHSAFHDLKS